MRENGSINPTSLTKWNVSLPKISVWPNACFCLYFIVYIVPKKKIFLMIIYLFYFEPQRNLKVALLAGIVADWCMIRLIITPKIHFFFICNRSIFVCHFRFLWFMPSLAVRSPWKQAYFVRYSKDRKNFYIKPGNIYRHVIGIV